MQIKICELFDYWMNDVDGNIEVRPFASYVSSYLRHHMRVKKEIACIIWHQYIMMEKFIRAGVHIRKNIVW